MQRGCSLGAVSPVPPLVSAPCRAGSGQQRCNSPQHGLGVQEVVTPQNPLGFAAPALHGPRNRGNLSSLFLWKIGDGRLGALLVSPLPFWSSKLDGLRTQTKPKPKPKPYPALPNPTPTPSPYPTLPNPSRPKLSFPKPKPSLIPPPPQTPGQGSARAVSGIFAGPCAP